MFVLARLHAKALSYFICKPYYRNGLAITLSFVTTSALADQPIVGKYLCVTDSFVGIWTNSDGTKGAGRISPTPDQEKFFIAINPWIHSQECFDRTTIDALEKWQPPKSDEDDVKAIAKMIDDGLSNPRQFFDECLAKFYLNVKGGYTYKSVDGINFMYGTSSFALFPGGSFVEYGGYSLGSLDSVKTGRCEFIPPAVGGGGFTQILP